MVLTKTRLLKHDFPVHGRNRSNHVGENFADLLEIPDLKILLITPLQVLIQKKELLLFQEDQPD